MKKNLCVILVIVMVLSLVGCGTDNAAAIEDTHTVQSENMSPTADSEIFKCIAIDGNLFIYQDTVTGVEYIVCRQGGITPRVDLSGNIYKDWDHLS